VLYGITVCYPVITAYVSAEGTFLFYSLFYTHIVIVLLFFYLSYYFFDT
jgi:hypothetical protein